MLTAQRRESEPDEDLYDTTQNVRKCVTPSLGEQGDAFYECNQSRRCKRLPCLRKAFSTEAAMAETMQSLMPPTSLRETSLREGQTNQNLWLLRRVMSIFCNWESRS